MNCKNCGFEYGEQHDYCPNCGTPKADKQPTGEQPTMPEPVSLNPAADRVIGILKDKAFLALCILMSVSCVFALDGGIPLISILITVFLWLIYADAQKGFANEKHLQCISGTVYAGYIITNVACGILIVCGVLFGALVGLLAGTEEFAQGFDMALSQYDLGEYAFSYSDISQGFMAILGWAFGIVFIIVAVIALVINILGIRKIHRFVKSVYMGIMFQNPNFEKVRAAKNWLMFFGVASAISAVMSVFSGEITAVLSAGCEGAAVIIASVLINKYLVDKPRYIG